MQPYPTILALILGTVMLAGCGDGVPATRVPGGNAELGKRLIERYQCASCHRIPGVAGPNGDTAPALDTFGRASYLAGHVPNYPDALQRWIVDPPAVKPGTLMPAMGVAPGDARHMAAYLYTLR
ncbi:c-type cytochrome [Pseudoduganella namucuonensis]|uniref:Cytochrome c2 n=1 Tax=Pseudoduganella namucuonensis TaxID=1035707 RepID=A0A1I7M245_9BURK|nr:c-type cytochrome [Pseudoduganella namucuonensis]SFV15979.1 Cytochrome c2 [Pseudoduganella namucuonensis]